MRLIDADALRAQFPEPEDMRNPYKALVHITGIWAEIDNAPTIELPTQPGIIHCKDCMFKETHGVSLCCDHITGDEIMVMPSDFCSWAERRQDALN